MQWEIFDGDDVRGFAVAGGEVGGHRVGTPMKLFTVSGAIRLAGLIVVLAGFRLCAQDVTITDPAWYEPENAPADTLPAFRGPVACAYPAEMADVDQAGYVIARVTISADGERKGMGRNGTHQAFFEATKGLGGVKYIGAKEGGIFVPVKAWYAVIFNPKTAAVERPTASPRLLAVAPVTVEKAALGDAKLPLVVAATISLDEAGAVTRVVFERGEMERFRPEVMESLQRWRFAAGRKDGVAVASEIAVPFLLWGPEKAEPKERTPPQAKKRVRPIYPREMLRANVSGEVVVDYVVDEKGNVSEAKVVRSSHREFEDSAVECVLKWKFHPALEDGKPVKTRMRIPITFNLNSR